MQAGREGGRGGGGAAGGFMLSRRCNMFAVDGVRVGVVSRRQELDRVAHGREAFVSVTNSSTYGGRREVRGRRPVIGKSAVDRQRELFETILDVRRHDGRDEQRLAGAAGAMAGQPGRRGRCSTTAKAAYYSRCSP